LERIKIKEKEMKLYKDADDVIHAYEEDGSQDHLIGDKVAVTQAEAKAINETSKTVEEAKTRAEQRIKDGFESSLSKGTFLSTVTGLTVDNRRSGSKSDRDNLDALIFLDNYPIYWKCADGVYNIADLAEANALKTEMIIDGLGKYQKKWALEASGQSATTVEELDAIVW
jgi:hypothetical protein